MPAIGFGSGLERLLLAMEASGACFPEAPGCELYLAHVGERAARFSLKLTHELRLLGCRERDTAGRLRSRADEIRRPHPREALRRNRR
jgi:histidyl-tRNA synthetase